MGSTDFGSQLLSFDYNQDATAKLFNKINYNLLPTGIYSGCTLNYLSNNFLSVQPGVVFIQDSTSENGTRIETTAAQTIEVSSTTPYVIFRFTWSDAQNNFMDMLAVALADVLSDDLIVGRAVYDDAGTTMLGSLATPIIDYTRRTNFYLKKQQTESVYLTVIPTEPASNKVTIASGVLNSGQGNVLVAGGNFPVAGLSATINGRNDLIYIAEDGSIEIELGIDAASPVTPRYGNKKVIAEIRRGAVRTNIRGHEIFSVISSFDMPPSTTDMLITDSGGFYSSANVEDALQEIAGSTFNIKGDKTFTDGLVGITAGSGKVALTVQGVSGQNIENIKKSTGDIVQYVDQNGKLWNTVGADIPFTDTGSVFTTDKYAEALNQIGNGTMTIKGLKTFNSIISSAQTTGTAPFSVISTTKVTNLNADQVDGYDTSTTESVGTIPLQGYSTTFSSLKATTLFRLPSVAPVSPQNGDMWVV